VTSDLYPLTANWSTSGRCQRRLGLGEHVAMVRALDRAGNYSDLLKRTVVVDVLPPTDELGNRIYQADPPHLPLGQQVDLYGVANDAGNAPAPSRPEELLGTLDGLFDATIWLGLPTVFDNDDGVSLAWLGDFNNDRLADVAVGLPAAEGDNGRVVVVYGRAGDWPAPDDVEPIADSRTSFVGKRGPFGGFGGSGLGATLSRQATQTAMASPICSSATPQRTLLPSVWQHLPLGRDCSWTVPPTAGACSATSRSGLLWPPPGACRRRQRRRAGRLARGGEHRHDHDGLPAVGHADLVRRTVRGQDGRRPDRHRLRFSTLTGVGDLDGDQYDDFAVTSGATVYLFLGNDGLASSPPNPPPSPCPRPTPPLQRHSDPQVVSLGDVDGDGLDDLIYQSGDTPQLILGIRERTGRAQPGQL